MNPDNHYQQAQESLQHTLGWYAGFQRHGRYLPSPELQAAVRPQLQAMKGALTKLEQNAVRIAVFGLVSRGKSAVLNALVGQNTLVTSPINGETKYPQSVRWVMNAETQIELIDTPGLDEIEGQGRATMAQEVAQQADLILFVVAGDLTRTEYEALRELRREHKPLILVFNKIDLYPDVDRVRIYQQLQQWAGNEGLDRELQALISLDEVVMVAADPAPFPVRTEWPDGRVTETWETPPPQIEPLRAKILDLLRREGRSLLALNALVQARQATQTLVSKTIASRAAEAEALIWQYAKWKAVVVRLNPIALLDVVGGAVTDLALIRSLAKLYGLPMTSFAAEKLWRKILFSSGTLLLAEFGSSAVLGVGKSASLVDASLWGTWTTTALLQGGLAGYGSYVVGKVAQHYLEQGCTWGDRGPNTVIRTILNQVDRQTIIDRLRRDWLNS